MQQQLNLRSLAFKFVGIEGVVTAIVDRFPQYLRRGYRKEMFTALVCVVWFLIGLSMVTEVNRIKFLLLIFLIFNRDLPKDDGNGHRGSHGKLQ